jgi:hypothetical protein
MVGERNKEMTDSLGRITALSVERGETVSNGGPGRDPVRPEGRTGQTPPNSAMHRSPSVAAVLTSSRRASSFVARRAFATTTTAFSSPSSSSPPQRPRKKREDKVNYNPVPSFDATPDAEHVQFRRVTANDLEGHRTPPTRVNMLVRDFIEDSLYNPNYGYFPKQVNIFSAQEQRIDFGAMRNGTEFEEEVARRYADYGMDAHDGPGRQIWHTPTELFQVSTFLRFLACSQKPNKSSHFMVTH